VLSVRPDDAGPGTTGHERSGQQPAAPAVRYKSGVEVADDQILAFRLARSGLDERRARTPAEAAACPASDFTRDGALLALAARSDEITREDYEAAVDRGDLALAHIVRGAIHALAPEDVARYGRALLADDDADLGRQLGQQVQRLVAEHGLTATGALAEVADATRDALAGGAALDKNALHAELRARVRKELMPWCRSCESHHVAPMLWRFATVAAGVRLDSGRRYVAGDDDADGAADAAGAVRRFLRFYGPSTPSDLADWAGLAKGHARRLWDDVAGELQEVATERGPAWVLAEDAADLASPPQARGVRLIPPGDPVLQKPSRPVIAPGQELRKQMFRPVASPGAVLQDGRLAGLWRAKSKGRRLEVAIEPLGRLRRADIEGEAERVAALRGARDVAVTVG